MNRRQDRTNPVLRPADENGDMLPVAASGNMLRGAAAMAQLVRARMDLPAGDWCEDPSLGNGILYMLRDSRPVEADTQALASVLSSYIRETPGVRDVRGVSFSAEERTFRFSCVIDTDSGTAKILYNV